ncbi:MAG TPA: hypothetical protein VL970_07640 [Candidatus Acidoferrales bacterium]|nr:hypothetical protein [Candidatus Acidoferrales bacterium]
MHIKLLASAAALSALAWPAAAWDYEGHHAINELALASLPTNFPAFALTTESRLRIAYLAGEPDRWRNEMNVRKGTGIALGHANGPDHYLDLEDIYLYGLTPDKLPPLRYDFVADIVKAREAHPTKFPPIDPARDTDHTRELCGFLPWSIAEYYEKLQSGFSTVAALEKFGGSPDDITNARQNIIYVMGVMGHFVGDASQPLHTTIQFNGWVGENPNNYTTDHSFHQWIDGGFFRKTGGIDVNKLSAKIHTAEKLSVVSDPNGIFHTAVNFIVANNHLVEPLYKLQKDGKLSDQGDAGAEGRAFLEGQLVKSGQLLGNLWYSAWLTAPEDTYLERELQQRSQPAAK